jgi:ABC-2 type transport system permease protein
MSERPITGERNKKSGEWLRDTPRRNLTPHKEGLLPAVSAPPTLPLWFGRVLLAFFRRELAQMSRHRFYVLTRAAGFGFAAVSLYFFSRFVGASQNQHLAPYGGDYLAFGLVGLLVTELQYVGVTALGQRVRMAQLMGFLEAELATPAPAWMVLGAAPVYEFGSALLRSTIYLVGASFLLGVSFAHANPVSVALTIPFVLIAFVGLGLLTAAGTMLTRRSNPVAMVLGAASVFLSGVVYPVTVLPAWLQAAGRLLPLTHALEALRLALLMGASPRQLAPTLGTLAVFGCLLTPAGMALFVYALRRARVDGSLTHY